MNKYCSLLIVTAFVTSCSTSLAPLRKDGVKPTVVTETVLHDTDDPAIWIHPTDPKKSLVIGTDKDTDGGLYVFNLQGKIIKKSEAIKRPNNVDIAYGLTIDGVATDVAVTTERETNKIRIFSLPDLKPLDNGGIPVFEGELERDPMGIAIYTRPSDKAVFAIVGRKSGPSGSYLWQYELKGTDHTKVEATLVRKFGAYSGKKEIEAIAVDNEMGAVYYSDEQFGIRKYKADPSLNENQEIALFGQHDFKADHEGIAIYKASATTGYILVSNQQANSFMVYAREGNNGNPNDHKLLAEVPTSTIECDGADATAINLGMPFDKGMFMAMSNGKTFHFYDWKIIQEAIDKNKK
ncbi:phytase [Flavobacterium sp. TSSA_36]|uniref:phytase n=1 Tax=Flavobacterium sp. TSSA_36 TaxID=3447669 RepID=UPI003F381240